jgi:ATP-dependent DNA helicase DinG
VAGRPVPAGALDAIAGRGEELLAGLDPGRGRRRLTPADAEAASVPAGALAAALVQLAESLRGRNEDLDLLARRSLAAVDDLRACLAVEDEDAVSWAEQGALAWAPVDVSGVLRETLWEREAVSVLVSATLEPRFLRKRLGLDEAREVSLPSPYDYREQALLYVPRAFPEPRSAGYDARLADEVLALCRLSEGRALVLTTSYRQLDQLGERVAPRIPYPVLVQGEAPRERLLERFRDEVDSVLIATQTFWQGVDVQGESLSLLVIDKLPFAAPTDPLVEARCERIAKADGDWFAEYAVPSAVLQLRQGFGRLIRGHTDRGVVAILDPRLRTRGYGRRFLEALPPAPLVGDLDAVAGFLGGIGGIPLAVGA